MSDISANNKRIAKNAIFLYLRMAFVMVITLYTTRVILKNLGIEDYGIYNVIYGFVTMFTSFNVTLTAGINRYYNYELGQNGEIGFRKVYNIAFRIQALFALIVFIIVEIIGAWYVNRYMVLSPERLEPANVVFQFSIISMIFLILQNPYSSAIMAFEKMEYYATVSIIDVFLKLAIAIGIAYSPVDKLIYYGFLMACISLINFLAYYFYAKLKFPKCICLEKKFDKKTFVEMLKFSGWMSLDPIAYSINGQGINMLLNSFFGAIINTAFGIANQVGQAIDSFCMNLSTAFRPQMVQCYSSGEKERSLRLFCSMSKICFYLFLLICVPLCLNIKYIYNIWLGDSYPSITIPISILFIVTKMIGCINHPISYIIMAKGSMKRYMITTSIITSSIIVFAYILLKCNFSVQCVFIAMIFVSLINQIASIKVLSIEIPEIGQRKYYYRIACPCIILSVIVFFSVYGVHQIFNNQIIRLIIDCIMSAIVTLLASYYIGMDESEKSLFCSYINKIRRKS